VTRRVGRPIWQRSYYERVIRGEDELGALREYIEQNPLRWALDRENPSHV
jgi:REP-associated tyrosine transposase